MKRQIMVERELNINKSEWIPVKFGDIVDEIRESLTDPETAGIKRVIGLEHIEPENIHIKSWADISEGTTFTKRFRKGDVLFGRRRAYLRKAAIVDFDGICSGDIMVFRAKENIIPELLPFLVSSDTFFDYAVKHSAGGLSPRVKFRDLANLEFLLPPKEQQAQLAELLWAMDEVVEREVEMRESLNAFCESSFSGFIRAFRLFKCNWMGREDYKGCCTTPKRI
ncbi:MAG: restriction endonuclease subunit S [Bacteroidota bacterium]|nr:restriction endonuclease subunit S [Bacteroidota bacterium]